MTSETGEKSFPGFSLVEVFLCLFLALCITGLVLPRYFRYRSARELPAAVSVLRLSLERARQESITSRKEHEVIFDLEDPALEVRCLADGRLSGRRQDFPPAIEFEEVSETLQPLVFRPDGSLVGLSGSIVLRDRRDGRQARLVVYGLTGRLRVAD